MLPTEMSVRQEQRDASPRSLPSIQRRAKKIPKGAVPLLQVMTSGSATTLIQCSGDDKRIIRALGRDGRNAHLILKRPGLFLPGRAYSFSFDSFEYRESVLGGQIGHHRRPAWGRRFALVKNRPQRRTIARPNVRGVSER